jgi:hypothetical protein
MPANWTAPKNWNVGELLIASDLNTHLRDNLEWLKSRPFNNVTIASTNTTSTSFVQMTGSSVSLSTVGGNVMIVFLGTVNNSGAGNTSSFDLAIDGTRQGDASFGLVTVHTPLANYNDMCCMVFMTSTPPSSGSHTYSIYWKASAGTLTGSGRLFVMEIR